MFNLKFDSKISMEVYQSLESAIPEINRVLMLHSHGFKLHVVDAALEAVIFATLQKLSFSWRAFSEECGARYYTGPESLGDLLFIIDPLDGTHNASFGFPAFTVSVALLFNEELHFAWIFDPNRQIIYSASSKEGAYAIKNGKVVKMQANQQVVSIEQAVISLFRPRRAKEYPCFEAIVKQAKKFRHNSCASIEICWVAAGILDVFVDFFGEGYQRVWDVAGAILVLLESGGVVLDRNLENINRRILNSMSFDKRYHIIASPNNELAHAIHHSISRCLC